MFYIGLSLGKEDFGVAVLRGGKNAITVESLHRFPYGPSSVKLFYDLLPFHTGKQAQIASGIASADIFIRKVNIPLKDRKKILAALPFQLESMIPFANESPLICPLFNPLSRQMTSVTVIATGQSPFLAHLEALKELGITPDTVSCAPIALFRFAHWQFPSEPKILCLDVRDQKVSCVVTGSGEIIISQILSLCDDDRISLELEKLSIFLKQKGAITGDTPWLLTGDCSLAEQFGRTFTGPKLHLDESLAPFALPIGLALDAFRADASSVQFCRRQFTPKHVLNQRRKKIFTWLISCTACALAMAVFGSLMISKKQNMLANRLRSCLPSTLSRESLSTPEDIRNTLTQWESSLKKQKNPFAFVPDVPRVSDVLAWLSTHPAFTTEQGDQKEGIEIKSFHYSLDKYPKIGDPSSPYSAHVDLEFVSSTPRAARDFHDALLRGDRLVNAKKEIKWQAQNQTYHTSFELNKGTTP